MEPEKSGNPITPETRIGALLKAYPESLEILIRLVPAFSRLRNPLLRKTVARVTTLRQAARLGRIPLEELINKLRAALNIQEKEPFEEEETGQSTGPPAWLDGSSAAKTLDARPILDAGRQPISRVMKELAALEDGKIYELITPFIPAPLIDATKKKGFKTWVQEIEEGLVKTSFIREK